MIIQKLRITEHLPEPLVFVLCRFSLFNGFWEKGENHYEL